MTIGSAAATDATVVLAVIATLGIIVGIFRWLARRSGDERQFVNELHENTGAMRELTTEFRAHREATTKDLHELDIRVTTLEANKNSVIVQAVPPAANRDPSPAR